MRQRIQWVFACLTALLALAVIVEAQLWVSSGTGLSTAGTVQIDGVVSAGSGPTTITNATGEVLETAINDGSVLARVAGSETISGAWTFDGTTAPVMTSNSANAGALFVLGRSSDGASRIFLRDNANSTTYGFIGAASTSSGTLLLSGTGAVSFAANVPVSNAGRYNSATNQPGFLVTKGSNQSIDGQDTVSFTTEVYDEASNFASSTFTAAVTGRYLLCSAIEFQNDGSSIGFNVRIFTSNRSYILQNSNTLALNEQIVASGCAHADMDASDTATIVLFTNGGTGGTVNSGGYFSGRLVP